MEMEMEITEHGPGTKFVKMGLQYTTLRLLKNNIWRKWDKYAENPRSHPNHLRENYPRCGFYLKGSRLDLVLS